MKTDNSPSTEARQKRHRKYRSMSILLAILILSSFFSHYQDKEAVGFQWEQTQVTITDPGKNTFTIVYDDVYSATLESAIGYGQCLEGGRANGFHYGQWQNTQWGTYTLCASTGADNCIVLKTAEKTFVLSYETSDVTAALYESILTFLP